MKTYPVVSFPSLAERIALGDARSLARRHEYALVRTGEKRPPRKGEWYISGAIPEGYRAPNDLSSTEVIGKLVRLSNKL